MQQLTPKHLTLASKVSIASALLGVAGLFMFMLEQRIVETYGYTQYQTVMMMLSFAGVGLLMIIYRTLQAVLHQRFRFEGADGIINLIIGLNIAAAVVGFVNAIILGEPDPENPGIQIGAIVMLLIVVGLGAAVYVLSNRIARLEEDLWGMMRPLYICLKASGICLMAVLLPGIGLILVPGAMIFGAASDLVLSKVFASAAHELAEQLPPDPSADTEE